MYELMIILGVDPALAVTGYGAIETSGSRVAVLEAGVIMTSGKEELTARLKKIHSAIAKLISDVKPDCLVLEKIYSHYKHPTTSYLLGQARGVICLACAQMKVPLVEYGATRVKKAVVGKGLAPKAQVQRMVVSILGLSSIPKYNDVTDALAMALAHSYIIKAKI